MFVLRSVLAVVRLWTALYTSGMPDALREARRAEIESDLWESQHDRRPESDADVAIQMLLRLLRGVPDDFLWRIELMDLRSKRRRTGVWLTATGGVLLAVALWVGSVMVPAELPQPPDRMRFISMDIPIPPPPPPPPPPPTIGPAPRDMSAAPPPPPPAPER